MNRRRPIILLAAAVWALLVAPALWRAAAVADTGNAEIDRGISLYDDLEYEQAVTVLEEALRNPDLTVAQRTEGYKTLALSYLALNRDADARGAFRKLLEANPDYVLDRSEGQKARDIFFEVKEAMPKPVVEEPVRLSHNASPLRPRGGNAIVVSVAIVDPAQRIEGVKVRFRTRGQTRFSSVDAESGGAGRYNATISGAFVTPPALEYYVVAVDSADAVLASAGSESEPIPLLVDKPKKAGKPITSKWWFWASVGGLVLAGAAAGVALSGGEAGDPDATVNITVNVAP